MQQSKYTDEEAEKVLKEREQQKEENFKKATSILQRSQDLKDYINIPSQIKSEELNEKPEVHPKFKNYDHSLEKVRQKFFVDGTDDGIEFGDLTSEDIL